MKNTFKKVFIGFMAFAMATGSFAQQRAHKKERGGGCKLCSDVFSAEDCAVGRNYAPEPALFNGAHESAGTAGRVYFQ